MKPTTPAGAHGTDIDGADPAELGRLKEAVGRLGPALERFLAFDGPDVSVTDRAEWVAALDRSLPVDGAGLDAVLDELERWVIPYGQRTPDPRFIAYVIGRATTAPLASGLAAQVAGHFRYFLTAFGFLEELSLEWLRDLCGIAPGHWGVYSSGGSTANLLAMGAARQATFEAMGHDVAADGVPAGVRARIYGGSEVHHTIQRSAGVLGLGRRAFTIVESDLAGRMDPSALDATIRADRAAGVVPVAIVAVAGATATGAVDRIDAIADVAQRHGVWLHVDGAYGLPAASLPELGELFRGVERADSAIVDPHKWLGTPAGCGATYVREEALLERAFTQEPAPYLEVFAPEDARSQFDSQGTHWYDRSVELSAPARGVWVWAALREIGAEGMRARIRRHIGFARHVAERAEAHERLELLLPPMLSICCFRYRPPSFADEQALNDLNARIVQLLRAELQLVPSTATVGGRLAIRPCFVNPATTLDEVGSPRRRGGRHRRPPHELTTTLRLDNGAYRGDPPRAPRVPRSACPRKPMLEAPMRHLRRARDAVVGAIEGFRGITRIRELEQELGDAHELIGELRIRLAEATRPPAQFARMRQREAAVGRFARLRLAAPRRARQANGTERVRDLSR